MYKPQSFRTIKTYFIFEEEYAFLTVFIFI